MSEYQGKKVVVLGMARSGIAVAELLCREGSIVTLSDKKEKDKFAGALDEVFALGCRDALGGDVTEDVLRGQDLLVISPGVPIDAPPVKLAQKLGIPVLGEMEVAAGLIRGDMVAVTGTNGKTTTVSLLGEIFRASGRDAYVCGNIGYPVSAATMQAKDGDAIVVEVSSFQLESIEKFHPLSAAVLNITEDHLNRHGTMERYAWLKKHIFTNQNSQDLAVLNLDDPGCEGLDKGLKSRVAFFSRKKEVEQGAFVRDGKMVIRLNGKEETVCDVSEIYIPGPHNLENALAAALIAYSRGVSVQTIHEVLRTFRGVEHRIEFVRELEGIRYINDSKGTNTDSTIKAIEAMTRPTVLILGGYDKHVSFDGMAEVIRRSPYITRCVLIGNTADQIRNALLRQEYTQITDAVSMEDAVNKSRALCEENGNVLLSPACASFDMFSDYEQRGRVFKQIVADLV